MSDSERPQKRNKIFRACDSCVTSKTRCDDVTPQGCLVCRKRSKLCSLAEVATIQPASQLHHDTSTFAGAKSPELRNRLELVEARAWDLEQRLRQLESVPSSSHISAQTAVGTTGSEPQRHVKPIEIDLHLTKYLKNVYLSRYEETIFWPVDAEGYPDVVKRGILSQDQVDMAFQLFKHRFSSTLPLAPFLLSSTSTPSHPFVILAILTHITVVDDYVLLDLVEESIRHAITGAVSTDVVLALLILALQPVQSALAFGPSCLRLIAQAYQIGLALGMESKCRATMRRKDFTYEKWWEQQLEEALLWEAVKLVYNLMHLAFTGTGEFLSTRIMDLPDHPLSHFGESIQYLKEGFDLIKVFEELAVSLSSAEAELLYDMPDLDNLMTKRQIVDKVCMTWPASRSRWEPHLRCISYSLSLRVTVLLITIPRPIGDTYGFAFDRHNILKEMFFCINLWTTITEALPAYLVYVFTVCIGSAHRASMQIARKNLTNTSFDANLIRKAEQKMYDVGGLPAFALKHTMGLVNLHEQGAASLEPTFLDPNDMNSFFNFDFATWDSIFSGFGQSALP